MTILFVCHSTGDTNVLLATARKMAKKTEDEIIFLVVGQAAKTIFEKQTTQDMLKEFPSIKVTYLSDLVGADVMLATENKELDMSQRGELRKFLEEKNIEKALIGTPSQLKALTPFQIAEDIASYINPEYAFIFNDYLFKENAHAYWDVLKKSDLKSNDDWRRKFTWLVPLPASKKMILEINSTITTRVVGHPSIDAILEQDVLSQSKEATLASTRKLLQIDNQQALLFVSGSKEASDDLALLQILLGTLEEQELDKIEIRMGIHPGILDSNLNTYISALLKQIESFPKAANHIKFIINDSLAARINSELLKSVYFIKENTNGDTVSASADGVASAVPSTLVSQAAIEGKPAYYQQADKEPYLPHDRLFVGEKNCSLFFNQVQTKSRKKAVSKKELGVPDQNSADAIAMLMTRN